MRTKKQNMSGTIGFSILWLAISFIKSWFIDTSVIYKVLSSVGDMLIGPICVIAIQLAINYIKEWW